MLAVVLVPFVQKIAEVGGFDVEYLAELFPEVGGCLEFCCQPSSFLVVGPEIGWFGWL